MTNQMFSLEIYYLGYVLQSKECSSYRDQGSTTQKELQSSEFNTVE